MLAAHGLLDLGEHGGDVADPPAQFALGRVYVGAGLGMSLHVGDQLIRGANGLAGEIGHLRAITGTDPAPRLADAIALRGLGRVDAPCLDADAVLGAFGRARAGDRHTGEAVRALGTMIGQAVAATCTIVDPELVLLGGPVGRQPELLDPVRAAVTGVLPGPVRIDRGEVDDSAATGSTPVRAGQRP